MDFECDDAHQGHNGRIYTGCRPAIGQKGAKQPTEKRGSTTEWGFATFVLVCVLVAMVAIIYGLIGWACVEARRERARACKA